jgi:hypothetical protein
MTSRFWQAATLAAMATLWISTGAVEAATLVQPARGAPPLDQAEGLAAAAPSSAAALAALAGAYVERGEPGMALAAIAHAPASTRTSPEVGDAAARAWLAEGSAERALAASRGVLATCAERGCGAWIEARAQRRVDFCEALRGAGVDDPSRDPEAARRAWSRSAREVRLALR